MSRRVVLAVVKQVRIDLLRGTWSGLMPEGGRLAIEQAFLDTFAEHDSRS